MSYKSAEEKAAVRKNSSVSFLCPVVYCVVLLLPLNFARCSEFLYFAPGACHVLAEKEEEPVEQWAVRETWSLPPGQSLAPGDHSV